MMRRIGIIAVLSLMLAALAAVPALAQTSNLTLGPLAWTVHPNQVTAGAATASGYVETPFAEGPSAPENIDVVLSIKGTSTVECRAPKGGIIKVFSGVPVTAAGTQKDIGFFPADDLSTYTAGYNVATGAPIVSAKTCTKKWTPLVRDVTWTISTVSVIQPSGSGNVALEDSFSVGGD